MVTYYEGLLRKSDKKIAIIVARFNSFVVDKLLDGALDAFRRHEYSDEQIDVYKTPGAFEIPVMLKKILDSGKYSGVLTLGAVIRGATPHFDYVAAEVSKGVANLSIQYGTPVSFGVLTTDNTDQAIDRAGTKSGNKGFETAVSLIEMVDLFSKL
jgi:6,7-dimethyl-8-ribityllumazine synthase